MPRRLALVFLSLLAACAPADLPASASPSLPAPQVQRATASPAPLSTAELPPLASSPEGPQELARSLFGDRLISYIEIPAIEVLAPVTAVGWLPDPFDPAAAVWDSPGASVGWSLDSALPGQEGNILLFGHNNIDSSVFQNLYRLKPGDSIRLQTGRGDTFYRVDRVDILPVLDEESGRLAFLEYFKPTRAPRLTVVSCWPPDNNTHRVVVIAYPER